MLQDRQHVGQRERPVLVIDLEMDDLWLRLVRPVEIEGQAVVVGGQLEAANVGHRVLRMELLLVADRESPLVALEEFQAVALALLFEQGDTQAVGPGTRRLGQRLFQRIEVDGRDVALLGLDDEMQTHQRHLAEEGIEGADPAVEGLRQNVLHLGAQARVEAVARHEDQAGHEALEEVAADEERGALAFLQMDDAAGDPPEFLGGDLEQLVARIGLQHMLQGLVVVTVGWEA